MPELRLCHERADICVAGGHDVRSRRLSSRTETVRSNREGTCVVYLRSRAMQCDRVIRQALRDAQDILWANLPPNRNLSDDAAVAGLRAVIGVPAVREAIERGDDTAMCFMLRAVNRILGDESEIPRRTIDRLWSVLDDPHLNRMLGLKENARMTLRRKRPPTV